MTVISPRAKPLTAEIIRLHNEGVSQHEIARRLGCTQPNVWVAIRRHLGGGPIRISVLSKEQMNWLRNQASRQRVRVNDLARAMLVDAVCDAMEGK